MGFMVEGKKSRRQVGLVQREKAGSGWNTPDKRKKLENGRKYR
jgi:hypothetical protein